MSYRYRSSSSSSRATFFLLPPYSTHHGLSILTTRAAAVSQRRKRAANTPSRSQNRTSQSFKSRDEGSSQPWRLVIKDWRLKRILVRFLGAEGGSASSTVAETPTPTEQHGLSAVTTTPPEKAAAAPGGEDMEKRMHGWRLRVVWGSFFSKHRIRQVKRKQRNAVWGIAHGYGSASGEWACSALLLVAERGMEGVMDGMECFQDSASVVAARPRIHE